MAIFGENLIFSVCGNVNIKKLFEIKHKNQGVLIIIHMLEIKGLGVSTRNNIEDLKEPKTPITLEHSLRVFSCTLR